MIELIDEGGIYIFDCIDKGYMITKIISKGTHALAPYLIVEDPCKLIFVENKSTNSIDIRLITWVPGLISPIGHSPLAMSCIQTVVIPDKKLVDEYLNTVEIMVNRRTRELTKSLKTVNADLCEHIFSAMDRKKTTEH